MRICHTDRKTECGKIYFDESSDWTEDRNYIK